ncbi:MAG: sodium ABC transporter [Chloroflexi bacterium RBG_16_56_11]|nr:MAG: sodium ABC transporter [Chloroflexi bacterium RBG_16_56_11]
MIDRPVTGQGNKALLEISGITKSFDHTRVVDNISFDIRPGEIFGLIGPNGAGKTTTIRMVMDIIKPDTGQVKVLGEILSEATKDNIGYLPEERGLYKKLTVMQSLLYIASLKGVEEGRARQRAGELLEHVGMAAHRNKKVEELSRGMSQLIQFLTTIIHEPRLMIMDEPFANLDPVNTELLKEMLFELRGQGRSVILSTHRMNEVEELCDRIFMINKGRGVLYGELKEIKSRYRRNSVFLDYQGELGELKGVATRREQPGAAELILEDGTTPGQILEQLVRRGVTINRYEVSTPPLHDIFLQVVGESHE